MEWNEGRVPDNFIGSKSKRVWIVAEIPSKFNKDACFYRTFVCNDGIWSDREVFKAKRWALLPLPENK